jgi:hypothetical protein
MTGAEEFDSKILKGLIESGYGPLDDSGLLKWIENQTLGMEKLIALDFATREADYAQGILESDEVSLSETTRQALSVGLARTQPERAYRATDQGDEDLRDKVFRIWLNVDSVSATTWLNGREVIDEREYYHRCLQVSEWLEEVGDHEGAMIWKSYGLGGEQNQ